MKNEPLLIEKYSQQIVNAAQEGIWILNVDSNIVSVNNKLSIMLGYSVEEMLGSSCYDFMDSLAIPDAKQIIQLNQQGMKEQFDFRFCCKDGSELWAIVNASPLVNQNEQNKYILWVLTNITGRKRAEEQIRFSEAIMAEAQKLAHFGSWELDLGTGKMTWSKETFRIFGFDHHQLEPTTAQILQVIHPEEQEIFQATRKQALKKGVYYELDYRIILTDGSIKHLHERGQPIVAANGHVIKMFGTYLDMTSRKQAESALQESQRLLQSALDALSSDILILDETGQILSINAGWRRFVQTSNLNLPKDGIGMNYLEICGRLENCQLLSDQCVEKNQCIKMGIYEVMKGQRDQFYLEYPCQHFMTPYGLISPREEKSFDNKQSWFAMRITRFEHDKMVKFVVTHEDITTRIQAEEILCQQKELLTRQLEEKTAQLSAAYLELARTTRLKDEFLASVSHELRTPLTAILGQSEIMQEQLYGSLNAQQLKSLHTIESSGRHLLSLINDILDVSKMEAGKLEIKFNMIVIEELCQASLRLIKQSAKKKQIKIVTHFDTMVSVIQADSRRLKQILVNLLSNAVKFTPEDGQIGLEVVGDTAQQVVRFTVWDTGIGISPEGMEQIFQPFIQLDAKLSRKYEGTGLGLTLVRRLTELHGGTVTVESEVGKGSHFTVSLPLVTSFDSI